MFLSTVEVEKNIKWLQENASPAVLYLTHINLLGADPRSEFMKALWEKVKSDPEVVKVFSLQNEDGSWFSGGPWGPRGYRRKTGDGFTATRPKFVTTAWILPFLGEIGFKPDYEPIKKSTDFILSELKSKNDCGLRTQVSNCCGLSAISLWGLASVGITDEECLRNQWEKLICCQRADGGWLNPNHLADSNTPSKTKGRWPWDRSCAWGTYYAVRALYAAADDSKNGASLKRAAQFLYDHLAKQNPDNLKTWVYHGHNLVRELEIFCDVGIDMRLPVVQIVLKWLRGFYHSEEGVFLTQDNAIPDFTRHVTSISKSFELERGPDYWSKEAKVSTPVLRYSLYHLVEEDWLTYRLTRLAMKMLRSNS